MKKIFKQILVFGLVVAGLAIGIGYIDFHILEPERVPPCNPEDLKPGHICLSTLLEKWKTDIIWIDARSEDAYERGTIRNANVFSIRHDSKMMDLLEIAMPSLLSARDEKKCIVVFCDRDCRSSERIVALLSEYQLEAPVFILEGGWDEIKKRPELAP